MRTAARLWIVLGLAGIAAYVAAGGSSTLYEAFGTTAWIAIAVGVWRNRPANRLGWALLCASQLLYATADILYFSVYRSTPPVPSWADALYLLGLVVFAVALGRLVGARESLRANTAGLADAAVLSLALGLFLWSAFFKGVLGDGHGLGRAVSIAYPALELVLVLILVRVLMDSGRRTTSSLFLAASVLLLLVSDAWYVVPSLTQNYVAGTWRDAGWLGSYVLAAAAALEPSMRVFVRRRPRTTEASRVVVLGGSLVVVASAALLERAITGHVDVYAFAGFGCAMAIFITVRLAILVRELDETRDKALASERKFRLIFERAPIGITFGRDGMMGETNPALQKMLGYTAEEFARLHYSDLTEADSEDVLEHANRSGRDTWFSLDKVYRRKDGGTVPTHTHVARDLVDGYGVSLIEDWTSRRELEEQLRQAQKMEAVGQLAGGVAHDFNNLMTAVLGYSDLILAKLPAGDVNREKIEAIRESAVRASDLTRQLLAFGRRQMLRTADVDLREVVTRMDGLLRRLIGERITLETVFGSEPVVVRADPSQLEQVVVNLVVNARDAMSRGGAVQVAVLSDGGSAVLAVADDGAGMDEQTRERIFEPFFTTKPQGQGSGLGLSTVHGIVGQSGGTIEVESAPGLGTTFTVRLPLVDAAALPERASAATLV